MKIMTCTQLGGACDKAFKGENFEDIIEQSKQHGMEMFMAGDAIHLEAIGEMQKLMQILGMRHTASSCFVILMMTLSLNCILVLFGGIHFPTC